MKDGLLTKSANWHGRQNYAADFWREYFDNREALNKALERASFRTTDAEYAALAAILREQPFADQVRIVAEESQRIERESHTLVMAGRDRLETACYDLVHARETYGADSQAVVEAAEKVRLMDDELALLVDTQAHHPELFDERDFDEQNGHADGYKGG